MGVCSSILQSVARLSSAVRDSGSALLVLAVAALVVTAPAASATPGVVSYFGSNTTNNNPATGGEFGSPTGGQGFPSGVAVNDTTGDVYVADTNNHRVQRFSATGEFVSAWGFDVLVPAASPASTATFEICTVKAECKSGVNLVAASAGAGTGGQLSTPAGVAVDQATGHVYVSDVGFNRVQEFTASGTFVRAFGQDVVFGTGGENAPAQPARQSLTIDATAGQFRLSFQGDTTADISFDASAAAVQTALQALGSIGAGNVTVTGGPGGTTPYTIAFAGALSNSSQPLISTEDGTSPLSGAAATATVTNVQTGSTGFEVCTDPSNCKAGVTGATAGAFGASMGYPAVAPSGAPNAGNVLVPDAGNRRVQEFTAAGAFVRAFGFDTAAVGPGDDDGQAEVQRLDVAATAGTFTLTYAGQTTPPIPFDASAATVQSALDALSTIGGVGGSVLVDGGPGDATGSTPYLIAFGGSFAGIDVEQIIVNPTGLGRDAGAELTCAVGPATAVSFEFRWMRNGVEIPGATSATYTTVAADQGAAIQCRSRAVNANAAATQVSTPAVSVNPLPSPARPVPPASIAQPAQSAALTVGGGGGQMLTCAPGSWSGAPTFSYQWYRNGVEIVGAVANTYLVTASDVTDRATFQCRVTGTNVGGAVSLVSANRNTAPAPASPAAPVATATVSAGTETSTPAPGLPGLFEVCRASDFDVCQAGLAGAGDGQFAVSTPTRIAEDSEGNLYTVEPTTNFRVQKFAVTADGVTPGGALLPGELTGSSSAAATRNNPSEIAVDGEGHVYVVKAFLEGAGDPPVVVPSVAESVTQQGWAQRVIEVDPDADGGDGAVVDTMLVNPGEYFPVIQDVRSLAVKASGSPLYVSTPGVQVTLPRVYRLDEITGLEATLKPATEVGPTSARLNATIVPVPIPVNTSYHFEYSRNGVTWERGSEAEIDVGNGSGSGSPTACPTDNPPTCEVSQLIEGLDFDISYQFRVVAETRYRGAVAVSDVRTFTTEARPPAARTGRAAWVGGGGDGRDMVLRGEVNPGGARTHYRFEYVSQAQFDSSGYDDAVTVPAVPADAGQGTSSRTVTQAVRGLDPSTAYHYRLLASNSDGEGVGADRLIAAASDADRFVELVTDGDGQGVGVSDWRPLIADDGERVLFYATAFDDVPSASVPSLNPFVARRGPGSWSVTPSAWAPEDAKKQVVGVADDLTKIVAQRVSDVDLLRGDSQWTFASADDGSLSPASPRISALERVGGGTFPGYSLAGGARDLSTLVFTQGPRTAGSSDVSVRLFPDEPMVRAPRSNIYEVVGAGTSSQAIRLVNRATDGSVIGGVCGARVGALATAADGLNSAAMANRAVSDDGSVIHFSAAPGGPQTGTCSASLPVRLYRRVNATTTVEVSTSQCTRTASDLGGACSAVDGNDYYRGASADGTKVFFTSPRQLTNSDTDATSDLYLYDSSPPAGEPTLVQVSAGQAVAGDHPTPGAGASVLGVSDTAADGSRTYFVANGRLTPEATQGASNLYAYQRDDAHPSGRLAFVASLVPTSVGSDNDLMNPAQSMPVYALPFREANGADGDGRYLVFVSAQQLAVGDEDSVDDVYRYDDTTAELICMSCAGDGPIPARIYPRIASESSSAYVSRYRIASDGDAESVVFTSKEQLLASDENNVADAYEWHSGALELVSGMTGDFGVVPAGYDPGVDPLGPGDAGSAVVGPSITADGSGILFQTRAVLLPGDGNGSGLDFYMVRRGGGFRVPQEQTPCEALAGRCQNGGGGSLEVDRQTSEGSPGNAAESRLSLSLRKPTAAARRRAARSGILTLRIRSSGPARFSVSVRARVAGRERRLGSASKRLVAPGVATVKVQLGRVARRTLRRGRRLALRLVLTSPGTRPQMTTITLRRAGK